MSGGADSKLYYKIMLVVLGRSTADKGWSSSFGVERRANNSTQLKKIVTKYCTGPRKRGGSCEQGDVPSVSIKAR
jgi:hypothetical protein